MDALERLDSEPLLAEDLSQTRAVTATIVTIRLRGRGSEYRDILFFGLDLLKTESIGVNRLANGLKMVVSGGHVRVPEFIGKLWIRTLTTTHQPDRAAPHVGAFRALLCQRFNGDIPVAVCAPLLIKPDAEEHQRTHIQIGAEIDENRPDISL